MSSPPTDIWLQIQDLNDQATQNAPTPTAWTWTADMTPDVVRNAWRTLIPALNTIIGAFPVPDFASVADTIRINEQHGILALTWRALPIPDARTLATRIPAVAFEAPYPRDSLIIRRSYNRPDFVSFYQWTILWEFHAWDRRLARIRIVVTDPGHYAHTIVTYDPSPAITWTLTESPEGLPDLRLSSTGPIPSLHHTFIPLFTQMLDSRQYWVSPQKWPRVVRQLRQHLDMPRMVLGLSLIEILSPGVLSFYALWVLLTHLPSPTVFGTAFTPMMYGAIGWVMVRGSLAIWNWRRLRLWRARKVRRLSIRSRRAGH